MDDEDYWHFIRLAEREMRNDEWLDHVEPDANPWGGFADGDDEGMT